MPKPLTTKDIASHCNVTQRAVVQWINTGKLKAFRTPGNHIRVDQKEFVKFLREFDITIPDDIKGVTQQGRGKRKLLIVDSDKHTAGLLRGLVKNENIDIDVAYDVFDAGLKFGVYGPDIVLLSSGLAGVNGTSVCGKLRHLTENKNLKILVLLETQDNSLAQELLSQGADDYLVKPFTPEQFMEKIMKIFGWTRRASDRR